VSESFSHLNSEFGFCFGSLYHVVGKWMVDVTRGEAKILTWGAALRIWKYPMSYFIFKF
jgi:hypothetical protein